MWNEKDDMLKVYDIPSDFLIELAIKILANVFIKNRCHPIKNYFGKTITSILIMDKSFKENMCKVLLIIVPGRLLQINAIEKFLMVRRLCFVEYNTWWIKKIF